MNGKKDGVHDKRLHPEIPTTGLGLRVLLLSENREFVGMTIMAHLNHHSCLFLLEMLKRRGWQTQPDDPYVISRTSKLLENQAVKMHGNKGIKRQKKGIVGEGDHGTPQPSQLSGLTGNIKEARLVNSTKRPLHDSTNIEAA
ncbi:hypothetical protein EJB05_50831, partial [Eragrostis curvula]